MSGIHDERRISCAGQRPKRLWLATLVSLCALCHTDVASALSVTKVAQSVSTGYQQRVAADPSFPAKAVTEIFLAAGTQMAAEWNRRGASHLKTELDFVVAGVLTACYGKFFSMWRVAPSTMTDSESDATDAVVFGCPVPTNAFQNTLLDGKTVPTLGQRWLSLVAPMPSLFNAGVMASMVGYGLTALLIALRTIVMPTYVAATRNVNVLYASLYTGAFMSVVSNLRYQVLQGIVEAKLIDRLKGFPVVHAIMLVGVRMANGLLGSILAISGMKLLGLQQLKS